MPVLLRLLLALVRRGWGSEAAGTVAAVCRRARLERGRTGAFAAGVAEGADLVRSSLRNWLGRPLAITGGTSSTGTVSRGGRMGRLGFDLRSGWRSLSASRANVAVAVLTLAVGIGANASVFGVLDSVVWRPVPYPFADRLTEVANYSLERKFSYTGMPRELVLEWMSQHDLFDRVESFQRASFVYAGRTGARMVGGAIVSPGLFGLLGARPVAGRLFGAGDGRPGTDRLAVVAARFWREEFQADRAAIGRSITVDGSDYRVVGVVPDSFRFPSADVEVWLPYDAAAPPPEGSGPVRSSVSPTLVPLARIAAGLDRQRADDLVRARGGRLNLAAGGSDTVSASLFPLDRSVDDATDRALLVLAGAVGFLLLIVCANLANLSLSRTLARSRDYAVRAALGASRLTLLRQTLIENLIVGVAGAAAGVVVAYVLIRDVVRFLPDDISRGSLNAIDFDGRVLAFTAMAGIATAVIFGLPPALLASRSRVTEVLARESRSTGGSRFARRVRAALVIAEVGLSIVLLVGASLMTRSLMKLYGADRGLDTNGLIAIRLGLPARGYGQEPARQTFLQSAVDRIRQLPGVTAATSGDVPPETVKVVFDSIEVPGGRSRGDGTLVPLYEVTPDFFRALGMRMVGGRPFTSGDSQVAVVVSEGFVDRFVPGGGVGSRFRIGTGDWLTIVGVVADVRHATPGGPKRAAQLYAPVGVVKDIAVPVGPASVIAANRTVVVRATNPALVVPRLAAAVHDVDPTVVVRRIDLVDHLFDDAIARPRTIFFVLTGFATCGLVLAAAGLYGVLSFLVEQRRREIGIRLALGARPADLGRRVVAGGLALTALGIASGTIAALWLVRLMRTLLYDVEPSDPLSIAGVAVLLVLVAGAAAWIPARRAMRVSPVVLLRDE